MTGTHQHSSTSTSAAAEICFDFDVVYERGADAWGRVTGSWQGDETKSKSTRITGRRARSPVALASTLGSEWVRMGQTSRGRQRRALVSAALMARERGSSRVVDTHLGDGVAEHVRILEQNKDRLLTKEEEIRLAKLVQRMMKLEQLEHELTTALQAAEEDGGMDFSELAPEALARELKTMLEPGVPPEFVPPKRRVAAATARSKESIDGTGVRVTHAQWAAAANISTAKLQQALIDGRAAREQIVRSNVGLVRAAVKQLKRSSGGILDRGTSEQDLMQEGFISLIRAAEKFDVRQGVRFSTYATWWVKAGIKQTLFEQTRVIRLPARVQNAHRKIKKAQAKLRARTLAEPTDEQISEELLYEFSPQRVREVTGYVSHRASSLDVTLGADGKTSAIDLFISEEEMPDDTVTKSTMRSDIEKAMERHLTPREVNIICLRFGLRDGEARTVRAIGEEIGLPYSSTRNLVVGALSKLRKPHVVHALKEYLQDEII